MDEQSVSLETNKPKKQQEK